MKIIFFLIFFTLFIPQIVYGAEISAIPEKELFGPNDWIIIFLDVDDYSGGTVTWNATLPDGDSFGGFIPSLKASKATHTITRNAFDHQFGQWNIEYQYKNIKKQIDVEIEPLTISVKTDKPSYGPNDLATIQFTTNYYNSNSAKAESLHIKILDEQRNPVKLVEDFTIKVSQPNIVLQLPVSDLLKYNPSGNYHAVATYYNVDIDVKFVVSDVHSKTTIFLGSDKNLYDPGDSVEINIVIPELSKSSGILTITSPSGKVNTKTISAISSMNRVIFDGITSSEIGTYTVKFDYGESIATKTFDVLAESLEKPALSGLDIEISLDKLQYSPGEIINATITISKFMENDVVYWFEDPSGSNNDPISFGSPISGTFNISHVLETSSLHGPWKFHMKYGSVESFAIFFISGEPTISSKILSDHLIPDWIRNDTRGWTENKITDDDFATGIEFMIKEKIIPVSNLTHNSLNTQIPNWVKNTATWWTEDLISDREFVNAIKFLISSGIIQVK